MLECSWSGLGDKRSFCWMRLEVAVLCRMPHILSTTRRQIPFQVLAQFRPAVISRQTLPQRTFLRPLPRLGFPARFMEALSRYSTVIMQTALGCFSYSILCHKIPDHCPEVGVWTFRKSVLFRNHEGWY